MHDTGMNGHSSEPPSRLPLFIAPLCVVLSLRVCVLLPAGVRSQRRRRALEAAGVLKGMQPVDQSGQDWQAWSNTRVGQLPNRRLRAGCLPSRQANRVRRCYQCVCVLWHMHGTHGAAWVDPPWQVTNANTTFLEKPPLATRTPGVAVKKKRSRPTAGGISLNAHNS